MDAGELAEGVLLFEDAELEQVIQVSEAPGDKAEARDAEQRVEDLRVDFDPDASGRVDVVAVFFAVQVVRIAHGGSGIAEEEEEHAAPRYDVEAVDHNTEAERGEGEFPEGFEADDGGLARGVFGRVFVAIGVDAVGVGAKGGFGGGFGGGGWR